MLIICKFPDFFRPLSVDLYITVIFYYQMQSIYELYDYLDIVRLTLLSHCKYGILCSQIGKIQRNSLQNSLHHNLLNALLILMVQSTYLQYADHLKIVTTIFDSKNVDVLAQNAVQFCKNHGFVLFLCALVLINSDDICRTI